MEYSTQSPSFVASSFLPSLHHSKHPLCQHRQHSFRLPSRTRTHFHAKSSISATQQSWLKESGANLHPDLDLSKADPRSRRGVAISNDTASPLFKGTAMATIPETAWLTPKTALKRLTSEHPELTPLTNSMSKESILALFLMLERSKGDESVYGPLISSLPDVGELDLTSAWTDEEIEMLRGSTILEKTVEVREGIRNEWQLMHEEIFSKDGQQYVGEYFSLDVYAWAVGIVDSRSVAVGSGQPLVLAPILHQLKPCSGGGKPSAKLEVSGGALFSKKKVSVVLLRDVEGGEEVTISFGDGLRNLDYLLERGLVVSGREADCVEMTFSVTKMDRCYEDKSDVLEMVEMGPACTFQLESGDGNGKWESPGGLDAFLRLLCLGGGDLFLLEAVFRNEAWGFMELPVSLENETMVCELIIGACEDALEGYEGEFGDDERSRMAKRVVEGEQEILREAMESYKRQLLSVDALEYYAERRLKALDLLRPVDESEIVDSESGGRLSQAFDEYY